MLTVEEQVAQLEKEISEIWNFHHIPLSNGEYKFLYTQGAVREAIKARQRKLIKLRTRVDVATDNPFPDVMSSSNC